MFEIIEHKILPQDVEYIDISTNWSELLNNMVDSIIRIKFKATEKYKTVICEMHCDSRKWILDSK